MDETTKALLESIPRSTEEVKGATPLTFTHFSRKDLLRNVNGQMYGNWGGSFAAACQDPFGNRFIDSNAIITMKDVGTCSGTGVMIVMAEHY